MAVVMSVNSKQRNTAVTFLERAASGRLDEAYGYVSANFRHHNPYFKGDAESLKAGMAQAHAKFPNTTLVMQHVLEDRELVAVHSRVRHSANTPEIAVVHIFRLEWEQIAELWDVATEAPQDSSNENGMF